MSRFNKTKQGTEGIAKGYRLKPETHKLVDMLQKEINGTKNDVISRACGIFYEELMVKKNNYQKKEINNNKEGLGDEI